MDANLGFRLVVRECVDEKILMLHKKFQTELIKELDAHLEYVSRLVELLPEWNFEKNNNYKKRGKKNETKIVRGV